jgi:hypothetical protein
MAAQLRIGLGIAATATAAWMGYVYKERSVLPEGRRRQFSPGSADDVLSGELQEGDLVLFARNCALYYPGGSAVCLATKSLTDCEYDHAGVVVRRKGQTCIAESTFSGVRVRPFEERVVCSRALNVVVRQIDPPLHKEEALALRAAADDAERSASSPEALSSWAATALTTQPKEAALRQPAALARQLYVATGRLSQADASELTLQRCKPSHRAGQGRIARFGSTGLQFRDTQWYRDRTTT